MLGRPYLTKIESRLKFSHLVKCSCTAVLWILNGSWYDAKTPPMYKATLRQKVWCKHINWYTDYPKMNSDVSAGVYGLDTVNSEPIWRRKQYFMTKDGPFFIFVTLNIDRCLGERLFPKTISLLFFRLFELSTFFVIFFFWSGSEIK